jgi:hypothetical protein
MQLYISLAAVVLFSTCAGVASATCDGGTRLSPYVTDRKSGASKAVTQAKDTLFFRTARVKLDIDGSPRAYGVRDQGLENICNGLSAREPAQCQGEPARGVCYSACQRAFRRWDGNPATLGQSMCSIGLGSGGCATVRVKLQPPPNEGFFVSETSVHLCPSAAGSEAGWLGNQEAQLDSAAVPYFVIPGGFRKAPWDATPGDVGVIVRMPDGEPVPFIVGDTGGALDEGSAKLLATLRGRETLPVQAQANAFGKQVERLAGDLSGDFRVAIFRHTPPYDTDAQHRALMLRYSAEQLPGFIRDAAKAGLEKIGGREAVVGCTQ